uniref:non-specific serine/threonine protein kinase n=1 Tax=Rhodnius prolixus TaxID=13249 RepID=T1ICX8_RHOPR
MAPIKKTNYQKPTCTPNVPPILTLRKKDAFDILLNDQVSNPFQLSTDADSVSSFRKSSINDSSSSKETRTNFFFPPQKSAEKYFAPKPKQYLSRVEKKKKNRARSKVERNSIYKDCEEVLSEFVKNSSSTRFKASTPVLNRQPRRLIVKSPFSPIAKETVSFRQSSMKHMFSLFENLSTKDFPSETPITIAKETSNNEENFYGFSSLKVAENVSPVNTNEECNNLTISLEQNVMESPAGVSHKYDPSKSIIEASNIENRAGRIIKEQNVINGAEAAVSKEISHQSKDINSLNFGKKVEEDIAKEVNIEENLHVGQEPEEEYRSKPEKKEPDNEVFSTESPSFEKERVIVICEQESLAEDDEDKSEDVSSALSSDQEAKEGVSSSDLESNSIDEEKDIGFVEMRRHSFEKISPRKSYMVGPFSRRRCLSMVPAMVSEGNEYAKSRENDSSYSFQSSKHVTSDNFNESSQKSSLMFCDSAKDIPDEERTTGGRSPPSSPALSSYSLYENSTPLDPLPENLEENQEEAVQSSTTSKGRRSSEPSSRRRSNRLSKDLSPSRQSPISRPSVIPDLNMVIEESDNEEGSVLGEITELDHFILPANKKYRRSLSIIRQLSKEEASAVQTSSIGVHKGRGYDQLVEQIIKLQSKGLSRVHRIPLKDASLLEEANLKAEVLLKENYTFKDHVMVLCEQNEPVGFLHILDECSDSRFNWAAQLKELLQPINRSGIVYIEDAFNLKKKIPEILKLYREYLTNLDNTSIQQSSSLEEATKVGEGVYGEVFMIARPSRKNVLKIIPIEGDIFVNGEKQKTYAEIYSELLITKWLDLLRESGNDFMTVCFAELISSWVIKGAYPSELLKLWDEYDENKGSDNDRPDVFNDEQLFLVLELGNAGTDLESYSFSTAKQALSIFKQTVFAVAVAEACFEFEHRDLHWGNVLISRTAERFIFFRLEGEEYKVITNGVKSTIIDYTLSRLTSSDSVPIFNDIGQDPDMFIATGDYQFDIYRHMKKDVGDRWEQFVPKTNVRWLHYLIDKMIKKVKYQRKTAKVHRDSMRCLHDIESWILNCDNSVAVAMRIADDYK